jgi:hypothetical protein
MEAPAEEAKDLSILFKGAVLMLPGVDLDRCADTEQSINSSCLLPLRFTLWAVPQEPIICLQSYLYAAILANTLPRQREAFEVEISLTLLAQETTAPWFCQPIAAGPTLRNKYATLEGISQAQSGSVSKYPTKISSNS